MKRRSPTLEGFGAIFRRPSLAFAEVSWRWVFGATAFAAMMFAIVEYLATLPVSASDLFLLRTRQPSLIGQAIAHILRGSGPRAAHAAVLLVILLALAWTILATLGRAATASAVLDYFSTNSPAFRLRSMAGLNLLRVAVSLAAVIGILGAVSLAGIVSPHANPSPGSAMLVFLTVLMAVFATWAVANWFLSLASLLVVSDGLDSFGAIVAAVSLCRDQLGPVLAASTWFGVAHGVAYFIASSVVAFPIAFAGMLPAAVVFGGLLLVALLYFLVVDFLYMGRLTAYLYIILHPRPAGAQLSQAATDVPPPTIDHSEAILSDVPWAPEPGN